MKNLLVFAVLFVSTAALAQNFEGTIKWSMKVDMDPQQKAQMEQAQKSLNDPEQQARIKEMQEKMNDPQMKAMMESNPQAKAQMEKMMAAMQGGNTNSMVPTGLTIKIKDQNTLSKMEGGMFGGETLFLKDKNVTYSINRTAKTYTVFATAESNTNNVKRQSTAKVTKTTETATILGYTCIKYKVDIDEEDNKMTQYIWATTAIKDFDFKAFAKQRMSGGRPMFYGEIEGVPLRMQVINTGANMTMEVTEIKREVVPASVFTLPADFKEVK